MILFLDFDGVLHPVSAKVADCFSHLPRLEKVLREFPHVQVVISSMWRADGIDFCRKYFSDDIKQRVIDLTPFSDEPANKFGPFYLAWTRHKEIMTWIERNDYKGPWMALDDDWRGFPKGCPQLLWCESEDAFDAAAEAKLRNVLENET